MSTFRTVSSADFSSSSLHATYTDLQPPCNFGSIESSVCIFSALQTGCEAVPDCSITTGKITGYLELATQLPREEVYQTLQERRSVLQVLPCHRTVKIAGLSTPSQEDGTTSGEILKTNGKLLSS